MGPVGREGYAGESTGSRRNHQDSLITRRGAVKTTWLEPQRTQHGRQPQHEILSRVATKEHQHVHVRHLPEGLSRGKA
eukprot:2457998-Prymnesium_polylepis.1